MTDDGLGYSVIIPWGGTKFGELWDQLTALLPQIDDCGEVLVVVNCSSERVNHDEVSLVSRLHPRVRTVLANRLRGPSYARNVGAALSVRPLLLFVDSDDVVGPDWVASARKALATFPVATGPLLVCDLNPWTRKELFLQPQRRWNYRLFAPSCNFAVRRTALEAVGGWDETLLVGEDTELSWRLQGEGFPIIFDPDMFVHYRMRSNLLAILQQQWRYGRGDASLLLKCEKYPVRVDLTQSARSITSLLARTVLLFGRCNSWRRVIGDWANTAGRVTGSIATRRWVV